MIKVALIALFVMSMGTLVFAASGLPVSSPTADQADVAVQFR